MLPTAWNGCDDFFADPLDDCDMLTPHVDMAAIEADPLVRRHLSALGLAPRVKWISHGCPTHDSRYHENVSQCVKLFSSLLEDVPEGEQDLEDTPYSASENIKDNLDNNID